MAAQAENSDVSTGIPALSLVAVAVTNNPPGKGKSSDLLMPAMPELMSLKTKGLVVTSIEPRNVWPSPLPLESHSGLRKNSMRNVVLAELLSTPLMVLEFVPTVTPVKTGKFCRLFGPVLSGTARASFVVAAFGSANGGGAFGVTEFEAPDAGPAPTKLVALTVKVYAVPLVNPVTVIGLDAPLAVMPPGDDVTV